MKNGYLLLYTRSKIKRPVGTWTDLFLKVNTRLTSHEQENIEDILQFLKKQGEDVDEHEQRGQQALKERLEGKVNLDFC